MRCGHGGKLQELAVNVGLTLPAVNDERACEAVFTGLYERLSVRYGTAGAVDDDGSTAQGGQIVGPEHVVGGKFAVTGQRSVHGDDVGLAGYSGHISPVVAALGLLPWRVALQHAHAQAPGPAGHDAAHMAHTHHADGVGAQGTVHHLHQRAEHILCHGRSIAARSVHHRYAAAAAVVGVDMVGANSGCGNEHHVGAFKQCGVAAGAGAHNQSVGLAHGFWGDVLGCEIGDGCVVVEQPAHKGDVALHNYFHITVWHTNKAA